MVAIYNAVEGQTCFDVKHIILDARLIQCGGQERVVHIGISKGIIDPSFHLFRLA
jgi:hypothetical protein